MRTALLLSAIGLLCAATARASNVTVDAPVAGGSTLAVTALNQPSFAVQLNGDDQTATYQAQLQVVDARGLATGGGWHLTVTSTPYLGTNGRLLPTDASTISAVTAGCESGSTCVLPANSAPNTNLALPVLPGAATFLDAASGTGLGRVDVNVDVSVAIPAATLASSYSSVMTVAVSAGP